MKITKIPGCPQYLPTRGQNFPSSPVGPTFSEEFCRGWNDVLHYINRELICDIDEIERLIHEHIGDLGTIKDDDNKDLSINRQIANLLSDKIARWLRFEGKINYPYVKFQEG